ncbi:unnamed protein product [Miscanthus lutarioriparius]|uniref:non-specific serine/threonine protein kinase n=1 Tax=Miscanthus lutarioriparius TaxID=422564 RepID=A0A811QVV1_9POAL|nr:unnamed protein product [Miscanthus lutarioriparius]
MHFCVFGFLKRHIIKQIGARRTRKPLFQITGEDRSTSAADDNIYEDDSVKRSILSAPLVEFSTVYSATNNFSEKLGEGGFGPVFKGILPDGQEIAIKRLSKSSGQGLEEFKNEVTVLSKLQHWNLVRLFGCCIHGEEKMMLYEYMPNKSLDSFIFNESKRLVLGWKLRYKIIQGIGRGLLYLHQDSRLKIIHRDLKASNILLDDDFNPKISDFGMARIFGEHQLQDLTRRIAQESWNQHKIKEDLLDSAVGQPEPEILLQLERCVQVGLLCLQQSPADRPSMAEAVAMLTTNGSSSSSQARRPDSSAAASPLATQATSGAHGDSIYLT